MKYISLLFIVLAISTQSLFCQNVQLYEKYSQKEGVESFVISKAMLKIATVTLKGKEKKLMKNVNKINVLDFEKVQNDIRKEYLDEVINAGGFKLIQDTVENSARTLCYAISDDKTVFRILLVTINTEGSGFMSMELFGNLTIDSLKEYIE